MIRINDGSSGDGGLPSINRMAILLDPAKGYLEWVRSCPEGDDGITLEELRSEPTVYLIPEMDAEPEAWLQKNFQAIFEQELDAWCGDDAFWPEDRSFKVFKRFFRVRLASMVVDMGRGPIKRNGA